MQHLSTSVALGACSFAVVFTMSLQQFNVAAHRVRTAFFTSLAIGVASLVQFKVLPGPTGPLDIAAYLLGSACGVSASILAHPWLLKLLSPAKAPPAGDPRGIWVPMPAGLHGATRELVERLAFQLATKLRRAEQKYGYSDGWRSPDWEAECRAALHAHVAKGDPLDVAAYAAFCMHHGWSTALPADLQPAHQPTKELTS